MKILTQVSGPVAEPVEAVPVEGGSTGPYAVVEVEAVLKFMGRTEVAHYLGMKSIRSLAKVELPPHDAEIGDRKGWTAATIDAWAASRPGRGRRGARFGQTRAGATAA